MASFLVDELITRFRFRYNEADLRKIESRATKTANRLKSIGGGMTKIGLGISGALFSIGRTSLGFSEAMNRIAAISQDSSEAQLEAVKKQALDLGRTTQRTATDAANAQVILKQSGYDLNEVLALTPKLLQLAVAGNMSMEESANLLTGTLKAFQLPITYANTLLDQYAKTANISKFNTVELTDAMRNVGPAASAANMSTSETLALLARLREVNLQPGQAGTHLKTMISRFLKEPTDEARKALEEAGLEFEYLQGLVIGGDFLGAIRTMADSKVGIKLLANFFGARLYSSAAALVSGSDQITDFQKQIEDSAGTLDFMITKMERGFFGAWQRFKSAWQGLQLNIFFQGLGNMMTDMLNKSADFLNKFGLLPGWLKDLLVLLIAAGPLLLGLGIGMQIFGGMILYGVGGLKMLLAVWKLFSTLKLVPIITAILGPYGIAIGGVIAGIYLIYRNWDWIITQIRKGWDWIKGLPVVKFFMDTRTDEEKKESGKRLLSGTPKDPPAGGAALGSPWKGFADPKLLASIANDLSPGAASTSSKSVSVEIGQVNVDAPGGDSTEIATNIKTQLGEQLKDLAEDFDGEIVR